MTTIINTNKINNVLFFNPKIIKDNSYKYRHYDNLSFDSEGLDLEIFPINDDTERKKVSSFKKFRDSIKIKTSVME